MKDKKGLDCDNHRTKEIRTFKYLHNKVVPVITKHHAMKTYWGMDV
jgi:hypothetical protein